MALTTAEIKKSYPLPAYNYKLVIDNTEVGFSEVSGLNISYTTTTYKESLPERGNQPRKMIMPAQAGEVKITIKNVWLKMSVSATCSTGLKKSKLTTS